MSDSDVVFVAQRLTELDKLKLQLFLCTKQVNPQRPAIFVLTMSLYLSCLDIFNKIQFQLLKQNTSTNYIFHYIPHDQSNLQPTPLQRIYSQSV